MPPRLVVPTEDLFAWTLDGRDSLLATPEDDPRTALSPQRYGVAHLLARQRHVMAFGPAVLGHLLGALAEDGDDDSAGSRSVDLPADLPADPAQLHARVRRAWDASAGRRAALAGRAVPDDDCDRRAVHTLLDVVPAPVLLDLLRWAGQDWRGRRSGWPEHLSWPAGAPADTTGRFPDRPCLVAVVPAGAPLGAARRRTVEACQRAGLEVLLLRVHPLGRLPDPGEEALGVWTTAPPECPACRPAVDVDPPTHLLPGELPLPPFSSPGVPEERHDHHLRAHLAATTPTRTVSDDVAALSGTALQLEAFALLTHPDAWRGARDGGRAHLRAAVRRYRDLAGDPHLAHGEEDRAEAFRDALTTWRRRPGAPPAPAEPDALREAARAAAWFLALQGLDVVAVREAATAVHRILRTAPPAAPGDPDPALRLFRLLSLGFTGPELLRMEATGTYPDEQAIEFLTVLRR